MTVVEEILEAAKGYPDRPALVSPSRVLAYGDLSNLLTRLASTEFGSSGTTGARKNIAPLSDRAVRTRLARFAKTRPAYNEISSLFLTIGDSAFFMSAAFMWRKGGLVAAVDGCLIDDCVSVCREHAIEGLTLVPKAPISRAFAGLALKADLHFKHVFLSGSTITPADFDNALAVADDASVSYNAVEVGSIAWGMAKDVRDIPGCVGRVADDVTVEIDGSQVRVRCPDMADDYRNAPDKAAAAFKSGWFYPGDLGHFEGELLCIDGRA